MSALIGSFDKIGNPIVTISVCGVFTGGKKEFEAVIDTGFTGFLQMPLFEAFPLGLVLAGTTSVTLADGSASPRLMAFGRVAIGTTEETALILLDVGSDAILIGMSLLRKFKKKLVVSSTDVLLEDEPPPTALQQVAAQPVADIPAAPEPPQAN